MAMDKAAILVKRAALEFDKISNPIFAQYDSQYKILKYLFSQEDGTARIVDMEREYSMTHPTTLGLVDALEGKGFVTRVPNPNDARGKLVALTDKSRAMETELLELGDAIEDKLTQNLSEDEKNELVALLLKLLN